LLDCEREGRKEVVVGAFWWRAFSNMAYDAVRAQLDELMGPERDGGAKPPSDLEDKRLCGLYLEGFCPSRLFANTKMDVGPCNKYHSDELRDLYQGNYIGNVFRYPHYQREMLGVCRDMISDVDRRIQRAVRRLVVQYGIQDEHKLLVPDPDAMQRVARMVRGQLPTGDRPDAEEAEEPEDLDEKGQQSSPKEDHPSDYAMQLERLELPAPRIKILYRPSSQSPVQDGKTSPTGDHPSGSSMPPERLELPSPPIKVLSVQSSHSSSHNGGDAESSPHNGLKIIDKAGLKDDDPRAEGDTITAKQDNSLKDDDPRAEDDTITAKQDNSQAHDVDEGHGAVDSVPPLPRRVWKEYETSDGKAYWHNDETGVSTWTKPDEQIIQMRPKDEANEVDDPSLNPKNKDRVCEQCGAFLSIYDSERRLADHFAGKMHIGFVTLREKLRSIQEFQRHANSRDRDHERGHRRKRRFDEHHSVDSRARADRRHRPRSPERYRRSHVAAWDRDSFHRCDRDRGRSRDTDSGHSGYNASRYS